MNIAILSEGLASILWVGAFALLALVLIRASRNHPVKNGGVYFLVVLVLAVLVSSVSAGMVFINPIR